MATKAAPRVAPEPMALLQITAAQAALDSRIAANDGVLTDEMEAEWDALGYGWTVKVDAYMSRRGSLLRTGDACKAEAARLLARAKACDTDAADLERRLQLAMTLREIRVVEATMHRVTRTPNPWAVQTLVADAPAMRSDVNELTPEVQSCVKVTPASAESYKWDNAGLIALYKARLLVLDEMKAADLPPETIAAQESAVAEITAIATFARGERLTIS